MGTVRRFFFCCAVVSALCCGLATAGDVSPSRVKYSEETGSDNRSGYGSIRTLTDISPPKGVTKVKEKESQGSVAGKEQSSGNEASDDSPVAEGVSLEESGSVDIDETDELVGVYRSNQWPYRRSVYDMETVEHEDENAYLPRLYDTNRLYKNAFYCAGANEVVGLSALIRKLRSLGNEWDFLFNELKTEQGDNLLLYAVKKGAVDVVRYLLSVGVDVNVADGNGDTPLGVAVSMGKVDIVNAIAEISAVFRGAEEDEMPEEVK